VTFVLSDDAFFTAVDEKRKSVAPAQVARLRYLRSHPGAALTVDHYEDDWSTLAWAQVLGQAQVLDTGDAPSALEALRAKYEQYKRRPPAGPLIRLQPDRFLCWRADDPDG
jgi:PPOX class probable F420-dependent enzyme